MGTEKGARQEQEKEARQEQEKVVRHELEKVAGLQRGGGKSHSSGGLGRLRCGGAWAWLKISKYVPYGFLQKSENFFFAKNKFH